MNAPLIRPAMPRTADAGFHRLKRPVHGFARHFVDDRADHIFKKRRDGAAQRYGFAFHDDASRDLLIAPIGIHAPEKSPVMAFGFFPLRCRPGARFQKFLSQCCCWKPAFPCHRYRTRCSVLYTTVTIFERCSFRYSLSCPGCSPERENPGRPPDACPPCPDL